jgi:FkbM family methyltransferase
MDRLRYSFLYRAYLKIKFPQYIRSIQQEAYFYKGIMSKNNLIFDIGANAGHMTEKFLLTGAKVVAVEPDKTNGEILKIRFKNQNVILVNKGVSDTKGVETFYIFAEGSPFNTFSQKWKDALERGKAYGSELQKKKFSSICQVDTVTLGDLIFQFGMPDYIKIDVEGHERKVIQGLSSPVPLLSFEANLPEFLQESIDCIDRIMQIDNGAVFNYKSGDRLAYPDFVSFGEIKDFLRTAKLNSVEIFCKMFSGPRGGRVK